MKRLREEESNATLADMFSDLPESLQLRILSYVHTRQAIRALLVLKYSRPVCSWTSIPLLNFNSYCFDYLYDFDRFVYKVLSLRKSSEKLEKLTFVRAGKGRPKILKEVFDYAFSHCVRELEMDIGGNNGYWPISLHASTDSLTSLKLECRKIHMGCSFLGPSSGLFKNLTNLHLRRVNIMDLDPFSQFPALDKLSLIFCSFNTNGNVLNVHALQLSELTISNNIDHKRCELTTPKLRYFEYRGVNFPKVTIRQGGLPILETALLDYNGHCPQSQQKMMFDDVLVMLDAICNVKSLTLFWPVVQLLSFFPDELVNLRSPFQDLKCLKLDFSFFYTQFLFQGLPKVLSESTKFLPNVKTYLLHNSHDTRCSIIQPKLRVYLNGRWIIHSGHI